MSMLVGREIYIILFACKRASNSVVYILVNMFLCV